VSLPFYVVGLLFGLLDTLFSTLVCYLLATFWLTLGHWNHDWTERGQGLLFFQQEALALAPRALPLVLLFLALAVCGGLLIGFLSIRHNIGDIVPHA
jgi:hypothetical protein